MWPQAPASPALVMKEEGGVLDTPQLSVLKEGLCLEEQARPLVGSSIVLLCASSVSLFHRGSQGAGWFDLWGTGKQHRGESLSPSKPEFRPVPPGLAWRLPAFS